MSTLATLAEFIVGARIDAVPPTTLDRLRLHLFDTVVAYLAGRETNDGQAVAGLVRELAPTAFTQLRPPHLYRSPTVAALELSAVTRCTEIDDIHLASCTTPGSVVGSTAVALAHKGTDPRVFLASLLLGYEVLVRFGLAVDGPTILYRGIWPTYLCSGLGAAGVASRAIGLSIDDTTNALATALAMAVGTSGRSRGLAARWLTLGCAVQNGILAAHAARHGLRGDPGLVDGRWSEITGIALDTAKLLDGLGSRWEIDRSSVKPYCAAKQATGAIFGFMELLHAERLDPAAIEQIVVAVPPLYAGMIDGPTPPDRLGTITSVQYGLALAALRRDELWHVRRASVRQDPELQAFMAKVRVEADQNLQAYYPQAWPARVTVRTAAREFVSEVEHTAGDPSHPSTWDDVVGKAQHVLGGIATGAGITRLAEACRGLETATYLDELIDAMGIHAQWRAELAR